MMFLGAGPIGCAPGYLAAAGITNGQCHEPWNEISEAYNAALEDFVLSLNKTFPDILAIIGKPYSKIHDLVVNGEKDGELVFSEFLRSVHLLSSERLE